MGQLINFSINFSKVDQSRFRTDKNGDVWFNGGGFLNEDPDRYGNNGFITQSQSKEEREMGQKLPILGNFKIPVVNRIGLVKEINPRSNEVVIKAPNPLELGDDLPF